MRGWVAGLLAASLAVVALSVALIGFVVGGSGATAIVDLDVGDCFDLPDDGTAEVRFELVDVVDCDQPHQVEVVAVGELNPDEDLPYPDDDDLFAAADRRCTLVDGVPRDRFALIPLAPTRDTWDGAGGRFACLALPYGGGPVTGRLTDR